jgi:hypothetical protein
LASITSEGLGDGAATNEDGGMGSGGGETDAGDRDGGRIGNGNKGFRRVGRAIVEWKDSEANRAARQSLGRERLDPEPDPSPWFSPLVPIILWIRMFLCSQRCDCDTHSHQDAFLSLVISRDH